MLRGALELAEPALAAEDPSASAGALRDGLTAIGASYFQARLYRRPRGRLTSASHWDAGGVLARHDPRGWVGSESSRYICFECNPLLRSVAQKVSQFDVADVAPRGDKRYDKYWEAWEDGGVRLAYGALSFGRDDAVANLHIGFPGPAIDKDVKSAALLASAIVAQHLIGFGIRAATEEDALTNREHDVMAYICEGKTDWEIGTILSISETTARFHADNARRKLGSTNRAHAVARYVAKFGLL